MTETIKETATVNLPLKKRAVLELNQAITAFEEEEINDYGLLAVAVSVWGRVNKNIVLRQKIEKAIAREKEQRRETSKILPIKPLGSEEILDKYDPNRWLPQAKRKPGEVRKQKDVEQEQFILDRTKSLRSLFEGL